MEYAGGAFQDEKMVYYPAEIMDQKQKEWEQNNPEAVKRGDEFVAFVKPEFYE